MRDFKKFTVIKLSRRLAVLVYALLPQFPPEERYALCQQLRRASVSVGANIAEGAGRQSNRDFGHFLVPSIGSLSEVEYLLMIAVDLGYLSEAQRMDVDNVLQALKCKLYRFRESLWIEPRPRAHTS